MTKNHRLYVTCPVFCHLYSLYLRLCGSWTSASNRITWVDCQNANHCPTLGMVCSVSLGWGGAGGDRKVPKWLWYFRGWDHTWRSPDLRESPLLSHLWDGTVLRPKSERCGEDFKTRGVEESSQSQHPRRGKCLARRGVGYHSCFYCLRPGSHFTKQSSQNHSPSYVLICLRTTPHRRWHCTLCGLHRRLASTMPCRHDQAVKVHECGSPPHCLPRGLPRGSVNNYRLVCCFVMKWFKSREWN